MQSELYTKEGGARILTGSHGYRGALNRPGCLEECIFRFRFQFMQ